MDSKRQVCIGIHLGHDRSVSAVEDGVLIGHLAEERLDRVKHSPSVAFPRRSLDVLLRSINCTLQNVSAFSLTYAFVDMEKLGESLAEDFRAEFTLPDAKVYPMGHHLAHAYSAFFTSPFTEATVVVADGAGDLIGAQLEAETAYQASPSGLNEIWSRRQDIPSSYAERRNFFRLPYMPDFDYPKQISISRKYEQFTYALNFGWMQNGKTMGLSAYGTPLFPPPEQALTPPFSLSMANMLSELETLKKYSGMSFGKFMRHNRQDIAATAQSAVERVVISICRHLYQLSPSENLCLAGGLFLNCVLNHKLVRETGFKNIHIVPACGDDGQSIGAAYFAYECIGGRTVPVLASPYQGPIYGERDVLSAIESVGQGVNAKRMEYDELISAMVDRLKKNRTVGLFRGRSEMGPRALGHRSILANPGSRHMHDHLKSMPGTE